MMETNITEVCSQKPSDIISNLPGKVINTILMCLPLRDAVRTSILSRKWRYTWAKLPKLTLDRTLWKETKQDLSTLRTKFAMILCHLLSLHQGPINNCKISLPDLKDCPEIGNLIFFLSRNGVECLFLELSNSEKYKLPFSIFTCSRMKILALHYCLINLPPTFEAFSRLHRLELCNVSISDKSLQNLISHCPLLEHLVLEISDPLNYIEVHAPQLRYFYFGGQIDFICFKNTNLLADVTIFDLDHESSALRGKGSFVDFFGSLPAVNDLCLDYFIIKNMIAGIDETPVRLPMLLLRLQKLYLFSICLSALDEVCCLLCLIRSSPYLEEIGIKAHNVDQDELRTVEYLKAEYNSDIKLNQLSKAVLKDISGRKPEMELIKLFLAKSPILETMVIKTRVKPESPQTLIEILKQVTRFQRASPRAEVIFRD